MDINSIIDRIRVYFNLMPDKDDEQAIIQQISSGVTFVAPICGCLSLPS